MSFFYLSIVGYDGSKIRESGSSFQGFSININSRGKCWSVVTYRLMDKFRFFMVMVWPKGLNTREKLLTIYWIYLRLWAISEQSPAKSRSRTVCTMVLAFALKQYWLKNPSFDLNSNPKYIYVCADEVPIGYHWQGVHLENQQFQNWYFPFFFFLRGGAVYSSVTKYNRICRK